ncbi:MAG: hypothetical protein LiPW30_647 [Parcubacteria group bacterium LiPW_30]|nr:MAG: hypothetical protein LiPW30_647 [Parcubacteria group bacterium LiPW_30]
MVKRNVMSDIYEATSGCKDDIPSRGTEEDEEAKLFAQRKENTMSIPCTATPGCKNNAPYGHDSKGRPVAIYTVDGKPACSSCYHEAINEELKGHPVSRHLPLRGCR